MSIDIKDIHINQEIEKTLKTLCIKLGFKEFYETDILFTELLKLADSIKKINKI